ncbi:MAG: hypothetical protein Q9191_006617, partial [Dirinaria sp. TL-2023a]
MDPTELDGNAHSVQSANGMAIEKSMRCIDTIYEIPVAHRNWIKSQYNSNSLAHSLWKSHDSTRTGPIVVEINTRFDGKWQNGTRYTIDCMLDVDIPQPDSDQRPHLGWEVKFNGNRRGLGHIWVPEGVIQLGRPKPGVELQVYGTGDIKLKDDFPCGGSV